MNKKTSPKPRFVKGLLIVFTITLLMSFGLALWSNMTSEFSTVLDYNDISLIQLEKPASGTPLAVMHTTAGDMTYILYPEQCPQTVANFTELAKKGYYDGTYIFRVEKDIFFSGGAKAQDGSMPEGFASEAQEHIPQELSAKLWPLRGALCAMTTTVEGGIWKTITKTRETFTGSRFLVCNSIDMTDEIKEGLRSGDNDAMKRVGDAFIEQGGIPNYAQQITVFGQLTEGFEILDAITSSELTGESSAQRPKEDILINGIEITAVP